MAAPFTVTNAMVMCKVDNVNLFDGATQARRIAIEVFDDDFNTCMDKTMDELDEDFKSYSVLTVANGQIRLNPVVKRNIRAFVQWSRDMIRNGRDPTTVPFPVIDATDLIRRHKTHEAYIKKSKTVTDTATPPQFTSTTLWIDWYPTFLNFLRAIPGRNGVPLSYVCRPDPVIPPASYPDFLDEYIDNAPLTGAAFITDANEVHTYLVKFIAENTVAEAKIQPHAHENNGRLDFLALKTHYEGVGALAIDVIQADKTLEDLFYSGEKKPHMWWDKFERLLNDAFQVYDRREGREVHSNHMKLRILTKKIGADFLAQAKASINLELSKVPITLTYEEALATFRNQVNQKYPTGVTTQSGRRRAVNQVNTRNGGRGNGRNGRNNGGRGRGGGRGQHGQKRSHPDARMVRCNDGTQVEVHASYKLKNDVWNNLPQAERDRLIRERASYRRTRQRNNDDDRTTVSEITTDFRSISETLTRMQAQLSSMSNDNQDGSAVPTTIMGGRNEQASLRSRNNTSGGSNRG